MEIPHPKLIKLTIPAIAFCSIFACTKDTDLLADYVVGDAQNAQYFVGLVQDDVFFSKGSLMILDVLANDGFTDPDKVKIVEVTQPFNGSVVINDDKTLTYTPGGDSTYVPVNENDTEQESNENETAAPTESVTPTVDQQQQPETEPEPELEPKPQPKPQPKPEAQPEPKPQPQPETKPQSELQPDPETQEPAIKEEPQSANGSGQGHEEVAEEKKSEPPTSQESPQPDQETDDNFNYKVEVIEEDDTVTKQTGTVTITSNERDYGVLKAFPTAYGAGSNATGGRGGSVYHVTNLNNSGPGSFRDAVSQANRYIVFAVSGTIQLTADLVITADNLTIAGQTAPEGGIAITGRRVQFQGVDNLIVRYIRFRPKWNHSKFDVEDAVECARVTNAIFDHISISWGLDETISFVGSIGSSPNKKFATYNVTLQHSLLGDSAKGMIVGYSNYQDSRTKGTTGGDFSVNNNVFAHISHRFPNPITDDRVDVINNVVHDWRYKIIVMNPPSKIKINIINNYWQKGSQNANVIPKGQVVHMDYDVTAAQSIYAKGNIISDEFTDPSANNLSLFHWWTNGPSGNTQSRPTSTLQVTTSNASGRFVNNPFPQINHAFPIVSAQETLKSLPNEVGASAILDGNGKKIIGRDKIDAEFVSNVKTNIGIPHSYRQDRSKTKRYIDYYNSVSYTPINQRPSNYDTDGDGMPNAWELMIGSDPYKKDHNADVDGNGYTNLEEYINMIDF